MLMNTKESIIEESIVLFSKNGYEGTSMTAIAQTVGIEKASLYAHYKGKQTIFECCLKKVISNQISITNKILTDDTIPTAKERLYLLIKDCFMNVDKYYYSFYYRYLFFPPIGLEDFIQSEYTYSDKEIDFILNSVVEMGCYNNEFDNTLTKEEIIISYNCLLNGISSCCDTQNQIDIVWKVFWRGVENRRIK